MSDAIDDMVAYAKFDDSVFLRILHSTEPELKEARDILKKVQLRQLYRFIGHTRPGSEKTRQDSERHLPDV
jgi:deoxynucleoside triphosphate triphosphohydrolase SAMHD1